MMSSPTSLAALAELSPQDALRVWRDVVSDGVRTGAPDLSPRQTAVLLAIYLGPPPHTVRGLAQELNLQKPAVTRALDGLAEYGFIKRKRDPQDGRNVLIQRTITGSVHLTEFGERIAKTAGGLGL